MYNTLTQDMLGDPTSMWICFNRGHSKTMWTNFCPILTTYLPIVDFRGHLVHYLPIVHVYIEKSTNHLAYLNLTVHKYKVIYLKYSKHWLCTVAYTIDCVCSKMLNHGLNHGLYLSLFCYRICLVLIIFLVCFVDVCEMSSFVGWRKSLWLT
jgi:hypothetical protein